MSLNNSFVRVYDGDPESGGRFAGTAFFIASQRLLTAAHVVQGCQHGVFLHGLAAGKERVNQYIPADSIECCPPRPDHWTPDVALLHCAVPQDIFPILPASYPPKDNDVITVYGFKDEVQSLMHRDTHISGHVRVQDCWHIADGVHKGMSGGAVIRDGELIGVVHGRDKADKITAYFIPLNVIHDWLGDRLGTLFKIPDTSEDATEQQRAESVFVGRREELTQLYDGLFNTRNTPVAVTALHGMAGVGKSWLVDHFYVTHQAQFPGGYLRLTLDAEHPASADLLLAELGERCELSVPQQALAKHLKARLTSRLTLVHIENLDSSQAVSQAAQLCRQLGGCSIVLSGRIENFGSARRWQQISLQPFVSDEALAQLEAELDWLGSRLPATEIAQQLVQTLGGLPLAIHLAAGYLAQGYTATDFLEELRLTGYALEPADTSDALFNRDAAKAVLHHTFSISLRLFAQQAAQRNIADADQLIALLGFAPLSGFGVSLAQSLLALAAPLCRSLLRLAQNLSLIDPIQAEPPRWQLHPLLADYLRQRITDPDTAETRLSQWFLQRLPEPDLSQLTETAQHGWHELNTEQQALTEWLGGLSNDLQYTVERTGSRYAMRNGPFAHWMLFCEQALNNPEHDEQQRSHILFTLIQVAQHSGNNDKAIHYAEEKYRIDTQRNNEREAALAKGQIADILTQRGNLDEALRIRNEDQLPVYESLGEVRSIAITKGKIADIFFLNKQYDEAFELRESEVLPTLEQLGDKRGLLVGQANLAIQYLQTETKRERACELLLTAYQSALDMQIPEAAQINAILKQLGIGQDNLPS